MKEIQLVGCAALCIASKYEEIRAPLLKDFSWVTDYTYNNKEIQHMESYILNTLEYTVSIPTIFTYATEFYEIFLITCQYDTINFTSNGIINNHNLIKLRFMLEYICEAIIQNSQYLRYPIHILSASCFCVALQMLRNEFRQCWNISLTLYTGIDGIELLQCETFVRNWMDIIYYNRKLTATRDKYSTSNFMSVGLIPPPTDTYLLFNSLKSIINTLYGLGISIDIFHLFCKIDYNDGTILCILDERTVDTNGIHEVELQVLWQQLPHNVKKSYDITN